MCKKLMLVSIVVLGMITGVAGADVIGYEGFDYADGEVAGLTGGTGWDWDNTIQAHTGTVSDWDWDGLVNSGTLLTGDSLGLSGCRAKREYNGPTEGDGQNPDTDERLGAFRNEGIVYYGVTMTPEADGGWIGLNAFDFGGERVFFGMPWQTGGLAYFGMANTDPGNVLSDIPVVLNQTYRLVGVVDFDGQEARLWVDPDESDYDNGKGNNSADVVADWTSGNWISAVAVASGPQVRWDDLVVATTFGEAAVPEPATIALLGLGGLALLRRKR